MANIKEAYIKADIKFNLNDLPYRLRTETNGNREVELDLKSFVHAPITTILTKKNFMEEGCFYASDVIGVVSSITNEGLEVNITIAIHPIFESIWNDSKKRFTIEYIERDDKFLVSSLYLEE